jgi:hypothetical protein
MIENVALLGLSCAFNPVLLAVVLLTLASEHPKRMLGAYTAGAFTWSVGLGIGVVAIATSADVLGSSSSASRPGADLGFGVLLLLGALWYASGRAEQRKARRAAVAQAEAAKDGKPQKPPLSERLLSGPPALAFFAGVVLNFPSVRYIAAMKEIVAANVAEHEQVVAILIFNLLMLSPAIVPLAFLSFRPEQTKAVLTRLDAWMRAHARTLITGILVVLGLYLTIKGIVGLV